MRFLCTHVVGKAETCAERMPLKAQDKGRMRTCQDMKNNNWRKNRFFAAAQNDREDNQNDRKDLRITK